MLPVVLSMAIVLAAVALSFYPPPSPLLLLLLLLLLLSLSLLCPITALSRQLALQAVIPLDVSAVAHACLQCCGWKGPDKSWAKS